MMPLRKQNNSSQHKVNPAASALNPQRIERAERLTKREGPRQGQRIWKRSPEELSGVRGTECCESRRWNKGGPGRSGKQETESAGIRREPKSGVMLTGKSEEVIILKRVETTELDRGKGLCFYCAQRGGK